MPKKTTPIRKLPPLVSDVNVKGECIGVKLRQRGPDDPHVMLQMLVEDDGSWYDKGFCVSSHWLDETIEVLKTARQMLRQKAAPDMYKGRQYGYKFK